MSPLLTAADVLRRYVDEDLPEFSEILLDDVNQIGNFGNSPIHIACVRGYLLEVQALLDGGAHLDVAGELGNTPLHEAVGQGHAEVVKLLLKAGASPQIQNEFGETPLDIAVMKKRNDIVLLISDGYSGTDHE